MSQTKLEQLQTKLAKAQAAVAAVQQEIDGLTKFNDLQEGGIVSFEFGRGENKKTFTGKLLGSGALANGVAVVSVLIGDGIDAQVRRVPQSSLTDYQAPGAAVNADPLEAAAVSAGSTADPLAGAVESKVDSLLGNV